MREQRACAPSAEVGRGRGRPLGNEPIKFGISSRPQAALKFGFFVFSHPSPSADIAGAGALRDDAFEVHGARMPKDGGSISSDRLAELDAEQNGRSRDDQRHAFRSGGCSAR